MRVPSTLREESPRIGHAVAPCRFAVIRRIMHILMITKRNTDARMDTCKYADEWRPTTGAPGPLFANRPRHPTLPQSAPHKLQSRHVLSRRPVHHTLQIDDSGVN